MKTSIKKTIKKARKMIVREHAYRSRLPFVHKLVKKNNCPELSKDEIKTINDYWMQFGIRIPDKSWFQLYYAITGIKDPRFIPQEIAFYSIQPFYNNAKFTEAYKDKNAFDTFIAPECFPKTIIKRIDGLFYDCNEKYITDSVTESSLLNILLKEKEFIIKNAIDSGRGENVRKYQADSLQDVESVLKEWTAPNYIVQKVIHQHPFFAQFNSSSVNIIRINTWYHNGKVVISTPVLRFGMPGHATDVCYIDGEEMVHLVGITEDGFLRDKVVDMTGKVEDLNKYVSVPLGEERVPAWDDIIMMIKKCAAKLRHFRMIGWDVTVNDENKPIIIEYNISKPSTFSSQITDGPIWDKYTDEVLEFFKDEKNRKQYLPNRYRI